MTDARLVLATGDTFHGKVAEWFSGIQFGEVVFNTGMVGYSEAMTDPSYQGQILTFTYPMIGNYGVDAPELWESDRIQVRAVIVQQAAPFHAKAASHESFLSWCQSQNVPVLTGVDTRALTKCLREHGVVSGAITTLKSNPKTFEDINKVHLVANASIAKPIEVGKGKLKLIAIDCGMKENIWRNLQQFPWQIKRVPFDYDLSHEDFDAVFISNGPGDPKICVETIAVIEQALAHKKPVFGICLGCQLMALAIGAKTYKLPFGHRSQNQPCLDIETGRCYLTSQNHGYAVDEKSLPKGWHVTYRNLNDDTVQGIAHKNLPFFAVQFHPEAAPGPVDTMSIFKTFYEMVQKEHETTE